MTIWLNKKIIGFFQKILEKGLDKTSIMCYNVRVVREIS